MNPRTLTRLLWQLPALTWLAVLLMPGLSWYSELFGPWPLWLLASPALLLAIGRRRSVRANPTHRTLSGAQVLVFPSANRGLQLGMPVHRRAA